MRHAVIYVPGLGDHRIRGQTIAVQCWRLYGVRAEVVRMQWRKAEPFENKLAKLLERIDSLKHDGYQVSLVGVSAGASVVVDAFALRRESVHRVVCVCGKLRRPETVSTSTYERNPAFAESMELLAKSLATIVVEDRRRICSIRPLVDETVPPKDTIIPGARNIVIPTIGHAPSIGLAITLFAPIIIHLLKRTV